MQTLEIGQGCGTCHQGIGTGLHEDGAQQQVFRRVAAQAQFGGEHHLGALGVGGAGRLHDLLQVALQVTHGGVDLGKGNPDRGHG